MGAVATAEIKLMIIEDHPATLRGLEDYLNEAPGFRVLVATDDPDQAANLAVLHQPEVIILDLRVQDVDGFVIAERLIDAYPRSRIVIHTAADTISVLKRARAAMIGRSDLPIRGFLTKDRPIRELMEALRVVSRGGTFFDPISASKILDRIDSHQHILGAYHQPVSLRLEDRAIMRLVAKGRENQEIAEFTGLSLGGVKKTLARLMRTTGTKNRVQLALWVLGAEFLEAEEL